MPAAKPDRTDPGTEARVDRSVAVAVDRDMRPIGQWLRDLIHESGYSETAFADKCRVETRTLRRILNGHTKRPKPGTWLAFTEVLTQYKDKTEQLMQEADNRADFPLEAEARAVMKRDASAASAKPDAGCAVSSKVRFYLQFLAEPIPYYANPDVASVALGNQEPAPDGYLDIAPNASFPKHRYPAKLVKAQLRVVVPQEWRVKHINELKGVLVRELDGAFIRLRPDPRPVLRELGGHPDGDERLNSYVCEIEVADGGQLYDVYIRMSGEPPLLKFQGMAQGQTVQMQLITHLEDIHIETPNVENPRKRKVIELLRLHKARMLPDPDRGYIVLTDVTYEVAKE
jgi:hypothetical protein